jgi:aspartate aminotransferase
VTNVPALSSLVEQIAPSGTTESANLVRSLRRAGADIVDLTTGEPDAQPPEHTQFALIKAMLSGDNKYTPATGTVALREAVLRKFRTENGVDAELENVIVTSGGKQLLFQVFLTLLTPAAEVIVPAPYWTSFPEQVRLAGGVPVIVTTHPSTRYALDPDAIAAAITPRTRVILVNSPNNPTGAVATPATLRAIAELARAHDLWIVADEIYEHLVYDVAFETMFRFAPERTIAVHGASKGFAMTGWRIGYALGPRQVIQPLARLLSQTVGSPNSLSQIAVLAALEQTDATSRFVAATRDAYRRRRDRFVAGLNRLGLSTPLPDGAFYALADVTRVAADADEATRRLALEASVAGTTGAAFGAPGRIRFSFATSDERLEAALERMAAWLGEPPA